MSYLGSWRDLMHPPSVAHAGGVAGNVIDNNERDLRLVKGLCVAPRGLTDAHLGPDVANEVDAAVSLARMIPASLPATRDQSSEQSARSWARFGL